MEPLEEYKERIKVFQEEFDNKKKLAAIECATKLRKYKIGDIISNGSVTIKIQKFGTSIDWRDNPYPRYIGVELKKDLTPTKNKNIATIFGTDKIQPIDLNT